MTRQSFEALRLTRSVIGRTIRERKWKSERQRLVSRYLAAEPVPRLHLGAGHNLLPGWLNTDISPSGSDVIFLDVTDPFPFADQTFEYVFSEHLIEHVSYAQGTGVLGECLRVLKPGGRIRIATPNLLNLVSLFWKNGNAARNRYVEWAVKFNDLPAGAAPECFVLNNFMRAWGHQFVYDPATLRGALEAAGFTDVSTTEPGHSEDPSLRGLEWHGRLIGEEANRFETMVLEARR